MSVRMDVEFSLALNNRTGKYFIGRDIITAAAPLLNPQVRYWRASCQRTPEGLQARILGRLMTWEVKARTRSRLIDRLIPRLRCAAPVLFSDPLQVLLYHLKADDVVICHDVGPITHPQFYAPGVEALYRKAYAQMAQRRPHIVFVTAASREQFESLYGPAYNTARIIPPAIRIDSMVGPVDPVVGVEPPFLLTVGAVGARKNQLSVAGAYQRLGLARSGIQYVICGGPEPGAEDVFHTIAAIEGVVATGYVTDNQLRWLYANACGFLLPSLLEGFGMPAAEAIARGLIPLLNKEGALAEVAGPGAILVDPSNEADVCRGITDLLALEPTEVQRRLDLMRASISRFRPELVKISWLETILAILSQTPSPRSFETSGAIARQRRSLPQK
jgi:glycosyltransferase involved in cell wall biosynthesis